MNIRDFFRLIRYKNLMIVFLTQLFLWLFVILPIKDIFNISLYLNLENFLLLSLSTILIAAGGYAINDYFDIKIDIINRPEKALMAKNMNIRKAIIIHNVCNIIGLLIGFYVAYKLGKPWVCILQFISTMLLWFYSTHFKRMNIIGNVTVAFLTSLSIIILAFYEPVFTLLMGENPLMRINGLLVVNPFYVLLVYTFFAFFLTWMREVVKDMEDYKGDAQEGCMTMPIKLGLKKSSHFVQLLGVISLLPLVVAMIRLCVSSWFVLAIYIGIFLIVPICYIIFKINTKATSEHYAKHSRNLKIVMFLGILSLLLYYVLQNNLLQL